MKIAHKERIVTVIGLAVVGTIAAMVWWTYSEVEYANRQRRVTSEIARGFSELSLVTVEYRLHRNERARVQSEMVSKRLDQLIADARFREPAQTEILADLSERRTTGRRLFAEFTAQNADGVADSPDDTGRRFVGLLLSELLTYQQENLVDAFRLNNLATDRIVDAQRRMMVMTLAGLVLIALIMVGASWFVRRSVLAPIAGLQRATRQVTAGSWDLVLDPHRDDEIGELANHFDAMTDSLRKSLAQVEHSNRGLAALNDELKAFSYSVSHDLRSPLRSMDGFSQVLLEDYGDKLDEDGKDALKRIRAASQRMGNLIDDLLRLSQVSRTELSLTRVDLSAMAREIADAIDREEPGRTVEWVIEAGLNLRADRGLLRIAMQNLLQNARKFTGKTDKPVVRVGALNRDTKTEYFVADNGVGFNMAHATSLFGAFQRLHHAADFPGSGIGLTIVQRIMRRHGGEIRAESTEGEGATFFFSGEESEHESDEPDNPAG